MEQIEEYRSLSSLAIFSVLSLHCPFLSRVLAAGQALSESRLIVLA